MSTDLPPLTDMKPRLVTTIAGNRRIMQSFTRTPWADEYYVAFVDSPNADNASNLMIGRYDAGGALLDYAILQGAGHGASITAEYESGKVWIWLFWGSDVGHPQGTPVRWAYQGTPSGSTVLLADAEHVPDPGAGDPEHTNGYFAIDQATDRIATFFRSTTTTTETYTLWKLSDYKAGTGSPLFTVPTTWQTGDKSPFQGFTISDTHCYIARGGGGFPSQPSALYELDWATGAITHTMDTSQLAATTSAGADGGYNEAEGVCLWRDQAGNPQLLFGIVTGPNSNRRGLVFRLAAPVDGTKTKTVQIDADRVIDGPASNVVAAFSYDRTVRYTTGGFTPTGYADPVKLSEGSTAVLNVSDHPDLTDDSYGFVIHAKLSWDDPADPGRRKTATYTAQLSAADPAVVPLSQKLVAAGAVAPGQIIAGAPGHSPSVTLVNDQLVIDGVPVGDSLKGAPGGSDSATASWISTGTATKAAVGTAIDSHLGGDSTTVVPDVTALKAQVAAKVTRGDERINVRTQYGAVPDWNGTTGTDNAAALAAAVTAAAAGSGEVFLPAGTYYASALPALPSGVTVRGSSTAPTVLVLNANVNGITNTAGASNCTVRNLTVQNASTSTATTAALIIFTGGSRHKVKDCILSGGKLGVCFNTATDSSVRDCEIYGQNGTFVPVGIYLTSTASAAPTGCKITGNTVHDMSGAGIFATVEPYTSTIDLDLTISGNTVRNVTDNGIRVQTKNGQDQGGYSIIGNYVSNPSINGIRINGSRAAVVGNNVKGGSAGIRDGGGVGGTWIERSTIADNICTGPGTAGAGIQLQNAANRCAITGNTATGWNYGIYIGDTTIAGYSPTGHTLTGNKCSGNFRDGIMLTQAATKCTLTGNIAKNNNSAGTGPAGITIDTGSSYITVTGNSAYDDQGTKTQNAGFQMYGTADHCLITGNDWQGNKNAAVYTGANTVHVNNFDGP